MPIYLTNPIDGSRWAVVPDHIGMTDEQAEAIASKAHCCGGMAYDAYRAMLAAAPEFNVEAMVEKVAKTICGRPEMDECSDVEKYFAAATHHSGDCTKEAHTCILCRIEIYRDTARAVLAKVFEVKP